MALLQETTVAEVGSGSSVTRTLPGVTAGSCLTLLVGSQFAEVPTGVSDDVNGAWAAADVVNTDGSTSIRIYAFPNSGAGDVTITIAYTSISANIHASAQEWSDVQTSSILDQQNSNDTSGVTSHDCGSITTTGATVIVSAAEFNSGETMTPGAGFTALNAAGRFAAQYKISASAETTTAPFSTGTTTNASCAVAAYKTGGGGGGDYSVAWLRA
jgi:hypothetical protein